MSVPIRCLTAAALSGLLLCSGCASVKSRPEGTPRPFGRRFTEFFALVTSIDDHIVDDWHRCKAELAGTWQRRKNNFSREVDMTLRHGLPNLVEDARVQWRSMKETTGGIARRLREDTTFALDRLWYDLKFLE